MQKKTKQTPENDKIATTGLAMVSTHRSTHWRTLKVEKSIFYSSKGEYKYQAMTSIKIINFVVDFYCLEPMCKHDVTITFSNDHIKNTVLEKKDIVFLYNTFKKPLPEHFRSEYYTEDEIKEMNQNSTIM